MLVAFVILMSLSSYAAARRPKHSVAPHPHPKAAAFDADVANNPATVNPVGPKDSGSAVLRAQILLDRAHFSVGEIDGSFGANMEDTLKAYQTSQHLPVDGKVNPDTWKALDADTLPVLIQYTILPTDVTGPFYTIPSDMLEQAKLPALGYTSVLEELAERFHSSPKLLKDLNPGKQLEAAGEQILIPAVDREPITRDAALVVVSKACSCVTVLDAQNQTIAHYPATMGSEHDPLPIGEWKIAKPQWNPIFYYNSNLFWDASEKDAKAQINPGPNNPVGMVWVGLSKEHYGIHGTPEPSTIGKTQSHGCIRLTNWDATELASRVKAGMTASLREN